MVTWNRAEAHNKIRSTVKGIGDAWVAGTPHDDKRFGQFDDLCSKAIQARDLDRVVHVCERYEASVRRDIEAHASTKQGTLF